MGLEGARLVELRRRGEVHFVEHDAVGHRQLLLRLRPAADQGERGGGGAQVAHDVLGVDLVRV